MAIVEPNGNNSSNGGSIAAINMKSLYGIAPGQDITTALQSAITLAASYGSGAEILIPDPGVYLINGAQQTGTAFSYTYSGQLLFPATADLSHEYAIRIRGGVPANSANDADSNGANGVVLRSNATSGNVFDCVPGFTAFGSPFGWTGVQPIFEDIVLQCPNNPQCGGIKATVALRFHAKNLTINTPTIPTTTLTGSGVALGLPQVNNSGDTVVEAQITGFPVGVSLSEHAHLKVYVGRCAVAFLGNSGNAHANTGVLDIEECITLFKTSGSGGLNLNAALSWENVASDAFAQGPFIDEWSNGTITGVLMMTLAANNSGSTRPGFALGSSASGKFLDIVNVSQGFPGWKGRHPSDDFYRAAAVPSGQGPGSCSLTLHPWRATVGTLAVGTNRRCTGTTGSGGNYAFVPALKGGVSRTISMTFTTGNPTYWLGIIGSCPTSAGGLPSGSGDQSIQVSTRQDFPYFSLKINGVTCGSSNGVPGGASAVASTYTLALKILTNDFGVPIHIKVYVNGTQVISYALTATDQTAVGRLAAGVWPNMEDGFFIQDANSSYVTAFSVIDAVADPAYLASGTATLVGGTIAVVNTRITATSVIRYWRTTAGGTLGNLSLALSAGVGFTINSSSGTDTSAVYYEIVTY